jgi:hypothetical protein
MPMQTIVKESLVYEEIDGHPIMYKNFHKVLLSQSTLEEIMGSSLSQSVVVTAILQFLLTHLDKKRYWIATNEAGLHLSHGNNLSADIAIIDRSKVKPDYKNFSYLDIAPTAVFEVDIKADMSDFASPHDYYRLKASKLLDFGVDTVVWVNTQSETVMFNADLKAVSWNTPISLESIPGFVINIGEVVREFCE